MASIKIAIQDTDTLHGALAVCNGNPVLNLVWGQAELKLSLAQATRLVELVQELSVVAEARQKEAQPGCCREVEPVVAGVNCDAQECPYVNARRGELAGGDPHEICNTCGMMVQNPIEVHDK